MPYTSVATVRSATGFNDSSQVSDAYITAKIGYADSVINSKVGDVYALPLSATCDLITYLSLEITVAVLFMDQFGEESGDTDKGWKKRLDMAMGVLSDIQKQKSKLYDSSGVELTRNNLLRPSFYPTAASSSVDATDSTAPQIKMTKVF